jgi:hypothetical protein
MTATVTRQRFFTAVAELGGMNSLYQYEVTDANTPEWVEFNSARYVAQGDPLYIQTQMALGYTSAEMQFLFDIALYSKVIPAQIVRARNGIPILDRSGARIESR